MPVSRRDVFIQAPLDKVWSFVTTLDNVAKCMPGYQRHEVVDERDSVWHLMGDVGILQKPVAFLAHIESQERAAGTVIFVLTGRGENMRGQGSFRARPQGDGVAVHLELALEGGGLKGPLVNALLAATLPRDLESLSDRLKEAVEG